MIELDLSSQKAVKLHSLLESLVWLNSVPDSVRKEAIEGFAKDAELKQVAVSLTMELDNIRQAQLMRVGYPVEVDRDAV